jgi:hypothetical protein
MSKHTALIQGCGTIGAEGARLLVADEVFSGVLIAELQRTLQQRFSLRRRLTMYFRTNRLLLT